MGFIESISTCFQKYIDFSGRASRSEFWWFFLFRLLVLLPTIWMPVLGLIILILASLVLLLPSLSVTARRLHDVNRTGWWMLLPIGLGLAGMAASGVVFPMSEHVAVGIATLPPIAGCVILLVFLIRPSDPGFNLYGPSPLRPEQGMETLAITNKPSISSPQPAEGSSVSAYDTEPTDSLSNPEPTGQRFCAQCGMQLQPDSRFCTACGAAV